MALPTEVIEALTRGEPIPGKTLDQAWVGPIFDLIQAGIVRPTEDLWGWTIEGNGDRRLAHEAAERGLLPPDFKSWHWADQEGWTVAHVAAFHGHLPEDFDLWHLENKYGWTVAHVAAEHGHLPKDFSEWHWADQYGRTVAESMIDYLKLHEKLHERSHEDFWLAPMATTGQCVMDFALERNLISSEDHEAIQQAILKVQQAHDQARMKTLSGMVF